MDDNAEKLGRRKMRSDAMKRQFAINGNNFNLFDLQPTDPPQITNALRRFWLHALSASLRMIRHQKRRWWLSELEFISHVQHTRA